MTLKDWTQSHRRSILFLLLALALAGSIAALKLPVTLFPTVDFPRVAVSLEAGDQPAEQMELLVTRPVEEAVRHVPGVRNVRSTTSRGSAEVSINFDWGRDMAVSTLQINAAIAQILAQLPSGVQVNTRRMDPTAFPIIAYSLVSSELSSTQLRDIAEYQIKPLLSSIDGVSQVQIQGGATEEYRVIVDPLKLRQMGLVPDDVAKVLAATNVINVVGRIEDHYKLYLVEANTHLKNIEQVRKIVLPNTANKLVHLTDIATVEKSTLPEWTRVTADGLDAVLFSVYQQPGSNSVQMALDIKTKLDSYKAQLPQGVSITSWYDQSELVLASATSIRDAVLIGVVLSAFVLFIFLRNVKVTLIAVIVVPAALATTAGLLYALNMSFNIMTLGGMAASVGLIIDDAIVMLEHIMRRLQGNEGEMPERVNNAAFEFMKPLAGSSASTLVIFVPLAFLTGVTGAFFKALSLTMAAALFISFLITWLAIPLLADRFLRAKDAEPKPDSRLIISLHKHYRRTLHILLERPILLLLGVLPLLLIGFIAFKSVGSGFMPAMDEGGFVLDYRTEPGTALSETDRLLRQVEQILRATPDIASYSRRTGSGFGGGLVEANEGDFFIRLKPTDRRNADEVMDELRTRVEHDVPGLDVEMAQLMEDVIGDLTAVPQPVEIKIFSDNPEILTKAGRIVAEHIAKIDGVVDVKDGINPAGDALDIHIDAVKAAFEGMDADTITKHLNNILSGTVATQITSGVKIIGVRVWVPKSQRQSDTDVNNIQIRAPDGHFFPLQRIATVTAVTGQPQIQRENLKRMIAVTARISNRDLGSVIADINKMMSTSKLLPQGTYYVLGGLYEQQQIAFHGLIMVFITAAALVFLLLLYLYESFRVAFSILVTTLLAVSAVFIGLWITGTELNISAMMGMTMIIGMVTEVAIFYFSEQQELWQSSSKENSLIDAGINRMRPIIMTTFAAILTLLPLAFAIGHGSEMQQPLAIAIISGLVVQLPLVLLLMPALFNLMLDHQPTQ